MGGRTVTIAAAQLGPIHLTSSRQKTLQRMLVLLKAATDQGAQLVLFPECAFTTFFPRHLIAQPELDTYFEHGGGLLTSPNTGPLFAEAKKLGVDISVGFAERTEDGTGYNTSVYYSAVADRIIARYRKIHLPGTVEPFEDPEAINQLEKRYFEPGNLGFQAFRAPGLISGALKKNSVLPENRGDETIENREKEDGARSKRTEGKGDPILGMLICNDRRWPEAWRAYALQGCELILCGYNTCGYAPDLWGTKLSSDSDLKPQTPEEAGAEALRQHKLVMQANSYMNSCFSVCAAKAGMEDGKFDLIGGSCIVDPEGRIVAEAGSKDDEIVVATVDLGDVRQGREKTFDFGRHRRIEAYGLIGERTGLVEVELL